MERLPASNAAVSVVSWHPGFPRPQASFQSVIKARGRGTPTNLGCLGLHSTLKPGVQWATWTEWGGWAPNKIKGCYWDSWKSVLSALNKSTITWFINLHKIIIFISLFASSHAHLVHPFSLGFLCTNLLVIPNLYALTHRRNFVFVVPSTWDERPTPISSFLVPYSPCLSL